MYLRSLCEKKASSCGYHALAAAPGFSVACSSITLYAFVLLLIQRQAMPLLNTRHSSDSWLLKSSRSEEYSSATVLLFCQITGVKTPLCVPGTALLTFQP